MAHAAHESWSLHQFQCNLHVGTGSSEGLHCMGELLQHELPEREREIGSGTLNDDRLLSHSRIHLSSGENAVEMVSLRHRPQNARISENSSGMVIDIQGLPSHRDRPDDLVLVV
jgi:hypothetical protein